jgi:hypothetical protein
MTIAAAALGLTAIPCLAVNWIETWDSGDLGGWEPNTTRTSVEARSNGGVDDSGYLFTAQIPPGWGVAGTRTLAAVFTGDYAVRKIREVGCDLNFFAGQVQGAFFRARYLDSAHGGWYVPLTVDFTLDQWQHCGVTFDPTWSDAEALAAGWVQEANTPSFQETMANVYTAEVRIPGSLDLEAGIDNFRLGTLYNCTSIERDLDFFDLDTGWTSLIIEAPTDDLNFDRNDLAPGHVFLGQVNQRETAVLVGVPFETVDWSHAAGAAFSTEPYPNHLEYDDTILVRTDRGQTFKVGRTAFDGVLFVDFCYQALEPPVSGVPGGTDGNPVPEMARLVSVSPNPFNPRTTITFNVDRDQRVKLVVHDVRGRQVRRLASEVFPQGDHTVSWNGNDDDGRAMPSGIYLARLNAETGVQTRKMMLVR